MRNEALYCGVPLRHENVQPLQIPVAREDARIICQAVQAYGVMHPSHFCPPFPTMHGCLLLCRKEHIKTMALHSLAVRCCNVRLPSVPPVYHRHGSMCTPDLKLSSHRNVQMMLLALCGGFICDLAPVLLMLGWAID